MSLLTTNSMLRIITLIFALSLLVIVDARMDVSLSHRHAPAANRMIKKRAGPTGLLTGNSLPNNVAQGPQQAVSSSSASASAPTNSDSTTPTDSTLVSTTQLTPAAKASSTSASVPPTDTPSAAPSNSALPSSIPSIINSVASVLTPNNNTSTSSSSASSSSSSSSATSTSSATLSTPSPTQLTISTPDPQALSSINPITLTKNETAPAATAASSSSNSGSVTKLQRNTIIILIVIGASVGGAGIIWTIIRKWKFSPSRATDDRLQPIDWQPTTGLHNEHDITEKLTRNGSTRSHGSFTSGNNNHDNVVPDLPAHDFTAGPAHLAPVGGYADLQRGPSPQPDLQRGPSFRGPGDYQYEIPNPHQQYYNGAPGPTAYQGGYNRGY